MPMDSLTELLESDSFVIKLADEFRKAGHELYLVGGPVRDMFLRRRHVDLDFSTDAPPEEVMRLATSWWQKQKGRPRFLWIHLYDPHASYEPPEPFASRFKDNPYLGEVAATDSFLAPLLGPEGAARLYRAFLEDAARTYARGSDWTPVLVADPAGDALARRDAGGVAGHAARVA